MAANSSRSNDQPDNTSGTNFLSRDVLTRGFNSFDDNNLSGYMIDEKELLDLDGLNSPDINASGSGITGRDADIPVHQSLDNFSTTPSQPIMSPNNRNSSLYANNNSSNNNNLMPYGNTPPIPTSTSPFDEFMIGKNVKQAMFQRRQQQQQQQQHKQQPSQGSNVYSPSQVLSEYGMTQMAPSPSSDLRSNFSPPHAVRFLQENGIHGNASASGLGTSPASVGSIGSLGSSYASPPTKSKGGVSGSLEDKQHQMLAERRRRRRESHNAVERRRRDNINEKIQELATLVPDSLLYNADGTTTTAQASILTKDGKPNKGTILSRSVDYIRHLQIVIDDQNRKELEMQDMIQSLQHQLGVEVTQFEHTSAELALARFRGTGYPDTIAEEDALLSPEGLDTNTYLNTNELSNATYTPEQDIYSPPN